MNSVLDWLKAAFAVQYLKGAEANFHCPFCGHSRFYFNWKKGVGFCHRASCGVKPSLEDLVELKGYGPSDYYVSPAPEPVAEKPKVELPDGLWSITSITDPWLVKALQYRGVTIDKISQYRLLGFANRVYIPITYKGELVQYIGRAIDRTKDPKDGFKTDHLQRFKYASNVPISNFIFDWDNVQHWEKLTLVENTIVAIANDDLYITTNFGSHLSDKQIKLIEKSKAKSVVLIWDEGSEHKADEAASKLRKSGIQTMYAKIKSQPDDHPKEEIKEISTYLHSISKLTKKFVDFKNPNFQHGLSSHPLMGVWNMMIQRCHNPSNNSYRYYGSRGIKVCDEWRNSFKRFYDDMSANYRPGLSIDRIDNNGNYELKNCRWVTRAVQNINTRGKLNSKSKYKGVSYRKDNDKWVATIMKNYEKYNLGTFDSEEEAALAYNKKAVELFGDFAVINEVDIVL